MRIAYISRLFSGIANGVRKGCWEPRGVPTVCRLLEKLDTSSHDLHIVFTIKDVYTEWDANKTSMVSASGLSSSITVVPYLPFQKLKGTYRVRYIDDVVVKGKTEPVGVYEVLDYHNDGTFPNLMDVVNHFNEGRKRYKEGDFKNSIISFQECLKANQDDALSNTYIDRCNQLIEENPSDWKGIWVMKSK